LPRIKCIKCGRIGNLTIKKTKTRGVTYQYYYVQHYIKETDKIEWCYLGPLNKLPEEYRKTLQEDSNYTQYTQHYTQTENPRIILKSQKSPRNKLFGSGSIVRLSIAASRLF
jgi:hypothetical protein